MKGLLCTGDLSSAKAIIKEFEGFSPTVYICPAGKPTIGWGFRCDTNTLPMTEAEAEVILNQKLKYFASGVAKLVQRRKDLVSTNEFNALVSFAYNFGLTALAESTLLRLFLAGKLDAAADEFLKWVHSSGKPSNGLLRRRKRERKLFKTP